MDYGVFMQGLAQAPAPVLQKHGHGGPSIMERFKRMAPPSFKGESQPLLAESWMKEVEKIFWAIRCAEEDKVWPEKGKYPKSESLEIGKRAPPGRKERRKEQKKKKSNIHKEKKQQSNCESILEGVHLIGDFQKI
ncbi:hypothetical protein Taro_020804 [Colocasia esculenta]|uniref:Uncharacterized protein n=1 Tax=Colocasia esculenta TaxID=4460 RepID=A0A843UZQ8_COLES|nr:hypothetical protein [Colocasia esculenta]